MFLATVFSFQFDQAVHERWDTAMANGVFRYNIDHIITRIIPGSKKYVAQVRLTSLMVESRNVRGNSDLTALRRWFSMIPMGSLLQ